MGKPQMIKSLTALAIFSLLGVAVIALPGFAPKLEAREASALAKGDRLALPVTTLNCSTQIWPDFSLACLQKPHPGVQLPEARLVTTRR
jgi:hypothetical protein